MLLIVTQILLLWMMSAYSQYYGYTGTCSDPYSQYAYSQSDYNPYGAYGYLPYSGSGYDYLQQPYSMYSDGTQQPIVIVVDDDDDDDDDWDWLDLVSTIASLRGSNGGNNGGNNGPVYIPYPVPMYNDKYDFDNDFDCGGSSGCGCKNKGCNCRNWDNSYYDDECNCDSCCDSGKRRRQKCRSSNRGSDLDCSCDKCGSIKHKCGRCRN